jgi:hypothetical protein
MDGNVSVRRALDRLPHRSCIRGEAATTRLLSPSISM